MKRIERILLTTNLAPHSDRAMERAVQLAHQHGADLTALYAIEGMAGEVPPSPYDRLSPAEIEAELRRHVLSVPGARELSPQTAVMRGPVHKVSAEYAELWNPDLMVAGAHRVDVLRDFFAVTAVERISVASRAPLLVVRNRAFGPYASALVAVDFSPMSRPAVEAAFSMVPEGVVHLLHVDPVMDSALLDAKPAEEGEFAPAFAELLEGLDRQHRMVATGIRVGHPMLEIDKAAAEQCSELIVMGTSGRTGLERTLIGSTAHEILERLPADVLLVRKH